jgi:Fe-S oxidoreductase
MASITKDHLNTIQACRYCPMCRQSCPSEFISYRESDTPRGRAIVLQNVYKTGKEFDESWVNAIYNCFVCGSCLSWCAGAEAGGYNIPELMKFARKDIVQRKMAPKIVEEIKLSLIKKDNPYNIEKSQSFTASVLEKKADVLYYPGIEIDFKNHEIAEAVIRILDKINVIYTLIHEEPSSGKMLDLLGYHDEAVEKARILFDRINRSGCKTIIVSDPLAFDIFKNDYPAWGLQFDQDIKILHSSEYLAELIKSGILKLNSTKKKITLADSEFLGRFNNMFEAPREIIRSSAGKNFVEMRWNHEKLLTTGEAAFTFKDKTFTQGEKLGEKISIMAGDIEAKIIITLSATAKNNIGKTTDIQVQDIAEFIAEMMV